jgi:hypothetical protein
MKKVERKSLFGKSPVYGDGAMGNKINEIIDELEKQGKWIHQHDIEVIKEALDNEVSDLTPQKLDAIEQEEFEADLVSNKIGDKEY